MGLEARIPCPVCRGPIHPVAGRCKHCKADFGALRTGKPQAPSALPALGNRTTNERGVAGPRGVGTRRSGGRALPPMEPSTVAFGMGSSLPSSGIPTARPEQELSPSWPVIVIAISSIAIILSIGALAAQLR